MDPPDVGDNHPKFLEVGLENGIARLHSTLQHSPAVPILQPSLNGKIPHSNGSLSSISSYRFSVGSASSGDTDIQYIKASELFPKKPPWIEGDVSCVTTPPFPQMPGEYITYEGRTVEGILYISSYRLYLHKTAQIESTSATAASLNHSIVRDINIPLGLIETIECKDIFYLNLCCKDARSFRLVFANGECCQDWAKRLTQTLNLPRKPEDVFSLYFHAWTRDESHPQQSMTPPLPLPWWRKLFAQDTPLCGEQLFRYEIERQGYDTSVTWRVSTANMDFKLSPSYPTHLLVPTQISDEELETVAAFRSARRLPAVVWRNRRNGAVLGRCSQPEVGWLGWRSREDEKLLVTILNSCFFDSERNADRLRQHSPSTEDGSHPIAIEEWQRDGSPPTSNGNSSTIECGSLKDLSEDSSCFTQNKKMLIIDARSYATAVANRARGGGCEFPQYYPQCEIEFMNLANIHAVRKSFLLLRALCQSSIGVSTPADQSNWFTQLDSTRWLHHMANLLRASCYTAYNLEKESRPVLVHCSDGWDRTPQIVSLAQLMLDPFYRTFKGFQILVQREWLEFGHKFADRCGLLGGCEDLNERCPVFLQFLDCVHQLMVQFPTAFQFNHAYPVKLVQHVYSNLFGTFLLNTVQERTFHRIAERSHSIWNFMLQKNQEYFNHLYEHSEEPLMPSCQVRDLTFWAAVYTAELGSSGTGGCPTNGCQGSTPPLANPTTSSSSPCSSGYATPQQTALTDSMVDTLAWKNLNIKDNVRNSMEDSTDTLTDTFVDDGIKAMACTNHCDGDLESGESFPFIESEALPKGKPNLQVYEKKPSLPLISLPHEQEERHLPAASNSPAKVTQFNDDEASSNIGTIDGHSTYQGDCPTCKKNWDLLNHNQGSRLNPSCSSGEESSFETSTNQNRIADSNVAFDLDGLLPSVDRLQVRLDRILSAKESEMEALRRELIQTKIDLHQTRMALCRQVCDTCQPLRKKNGGSHGNEGLDDESGSEASATGQRATTDDPLGGPNSSPSSWESVDEREIPNDKGPTIRWVPDHAAHSCMKCSEPFWIGRRRHHCRNCGEVCCADCAGRDLPIPDQNHYKPVRVCNVCYNLLTNAVSTGDSEGSSSSCPTNHQQSLSEFPSTIPRGRAYSLSNLTAAHCGCQCCQLKRLNKFKAVTAASN